MKKRVMIPLATAILASQASNVVGAEYVLGANFSPTFSYDDNVQLREDEEGSFSTEIRPTLSLSRSEQNSQISVRAGLNVERYASLSRLDREDPFANFSSGFNTERSTFGLSGNYSENAQRDIAEEDTGNFASNTTVTSKSLTPSYQYQLTEKDSVYASLNYSERTYGGGTESDFSDPNNLIFGDNFSDNETISLTTGWQRSFTERFTGGVAITYAQYDAESDIRETEYDTFNYALTSSYILSEKWSLSGQIGYRTLENEIRQFGGQRLTDESSGTLFSLSSNYSGETNDVSFSLGRSLSPSGEGVVNEQDRIAVNWNRDLTETLSFGLNTSYQETQTADSINNTDRKYFSIAPSMNWRLQENLSLKFGYRYRQQKGSDFDAVDSNMVFLTVGYDWDGWRFSR